MIRSIMMNIHYHIFHILAKRQIEEMYDKMELDTRTEFFEKICPEKADKFDEARERVWVPLYNEYIKRDE